MRSRTKTNIMRMPAAKEDKQQMGENNRDKNQVEVKGIISGKPVFSHSVLGESFYTADLLVDRYSALQDRIYQPCQ